MLSVLSPAKSLDFESPLPTKKHSEPRLIGQSDGLIEIMRTKSPADISRLMHISDDLAHLNATRYQDFTSEHTAKNARPAILAFNGDVYQGLQAHTFDARDFTEAQKSLRILSGLYGLLRPMDLIQPHRLEMGTRLASARGQSLYDWWGSQVTDLLHRDLDSSPGADVLINLASTEYFKVLDGERLGARIISPRFEDRDKDGEPRIVSFYAKRARGTMAAWLVKERVRTPSRLLDFNRDGYEYDEARSTKDQPVFVR
ncbi:peroxide stress protein YaaA [Tessaracoccus sp. MC1756]|uniref:peroxide stress protein YaaA n=1 Tax=Tessaracoccus sp. MC1756 TaxID=2760311 RepID=UPI001601DFE0|nr:peroxide stress protein YaaA [Tessaracoccus sp. MC1756]MBB1510362.1 peroxide stress protein YaaA [Tessaracoccus sp. MC1756]